MKSERFIVAPKAETFRALPLCPVEKGVWSVASIAPFPPSWDSMDDSQWLPVSVHGEGMGFALSELTTSDKPTQKLCKTPNTPKKTFLQKRRFYSKGNAALDFINFWAYWLGKTICDLGPLHESVLELLRILGKPWRWLHPSPLSLLQARRSTDREAALELCYP